MEVWKDIHGYEGLYMVSNFGRVMSLERRVSARHGTRLVRERILIVKVNNRRRGYCSVILSRDCSQKTYKLHRLVMRTFIGEDSRSVNHIDGDKGNNRLDNLEYCTNQENIDHAVSLGLINIKGELNPNSTLTFREVVEIKDLIKDGLKDIEIAKLYGVSKTAVWKIRHGKRWYNV